MPRTSNRGRGQQPASSPHSPNALPACYAQDAPGLQDHPSGFDTQDRGFANNGADTAQHAGFVGAVPPSSLERDSRAIPAPLGVGVASPLPPTGAAPPPARRPGEPTPTWWPGCGRKARTGDVAKGGRYGSACALKGADGGKVLRSGPRLSASEARTIAKHAQRQAMTGARVVLDRAGRPITGTIPTHGADIVRAVLRWTRRVIGRPVGIRGCLEGLRAIGWCK